MGPYAGENAALMAAALCAAVFGMLAGGTLFVILRIRRLQGTAKNKGHRPAQRLLSMVFPDLFPAALEPVQPRILCVNGSGTRLQAMKGLLEEQEFEVWTARNMSDGFDLLSHVGVEAVITESDSMDQSDLRRCWQIQPGVPVLSPSGELVLPREAGVVGRTPAIRQWRPSAQVALLGDVLASHGLS
jgi:hypothetical protein